MKTYIYILVVFSVMCMVGCCKPMPEDYALNKRYSRNSVDDTFLVHTMHYNLALADMARIAVTTTTDSGVMTLSREIISDMEIEQKKLRSLAFGALLLPETYKEQHTTERIRIEDLKGREFNSSYLQYQLAIYSKVVSLLNTEIQFGQYESITIYANERLPVLLSKQRYVDSLLQHL